MADPVEGDEFRGYWFGLPVSVFLRDGDPDGPPVSIELRAAGDPVVVEVSGGSVRTRPGPAGFPDLVLAGDPWLILDMFRGKLTAAEAAKHGLEITGDDTVLRRVIPEPAATLPNRKDDDDQRH
jgi:hypothetical protein